MRKKKRRKNGKKIRKKIGKKLKNIIRKRGKGKKEVKDRTERARIERREV